MGFGKSVAARSMSGKTPDRFFSFTLPSGCHSVEAFWDISLDRLEAQGFSETGLLRDSGFPRTREQFRLTAEILGGGAERRVVILDDYHLAAGAELDVFVSGLIRAAPGGLRVALFSRALPDIASGVDSTAVFDHNLLAFTPDEARELFRRHGVANPDAATAAWEYSRGWPAVLSLCLREYLASGTLIPIPEVDALLAQAVFPGFDPGERELLTRLSVLDSFTEEEALTLSSDENVCGRLENLRRKNAFSNHDETTGRYCIHEVFREFLNSELSSSELNAPVLFRRAAECRVARGELHEAFLLLRKAGRDVDLKRVLELFLMPDAEAMVGDFLRDVTAGVMAIPPNVRLKEPLGFLAFVWHCLVVGVGAKATVWLDEARELFLRSPEISPAVRRRLSGEMAFMEGLLHFNDIWVLTSKLEEASALLDGPSEICFRRRPWSFGSPTLMAMVLREPGVCRSTIRKLKSVDPAVNRLTGGYCESALSVLTMENAVERGQFTLARQLCAGIEAGGEEPDRIAGLLAAAFCRARMLAAEGRGDEAAALLEEWRARAEDMGCRDHVESVELAMGYVYGGLGRVESIPEWIRDGGMFEPPHAVLQRRGFSLVAYCKSLLAAGDYGRLEAVAGCIPFHCEPYGSLFGMIHGRALEAVAAHSGGRVDEALENMGMAVDLTRPDGFVFSLAEYGGHVLSLLRRMRKDDPSDEHLESIVRMAERVRGRSATTRRRGGNVMTPREREMMGLVVRGDSNLEIARKLGVAEVTVKKTLSAAYGKLGAGNRAAAAFLFEAAQR